MVDNQHRLINGYRDLAPHEIAMINGVKEAEAALGSVWHTVTEADNVDMRWANIARTHFEEGFSALVRSIAQPEPRY